MFITKGMQDETIAQYKLQGPKLMAALLQFVENEFDFDSNSNSGNLDVDEDDDDTEGLLVSKNLID